MNSYKFLKHTQRTILQTAAEARWFRAVTSQQHISCVRLNQIGLLSRLRSPDARTFEITEKGAAVAALLAA